MKLIVKQKDTLLNYLNNAKLDYSNTKLKSLLKHGCIRINGVINTQFDTIVKEGDILLITSYNAAHDTDLDILYEDENILVINKKPGQLSIATKKNESNTAYRAASDYVKLSNPLNKVFVIHRLDQDTSGVLMFAKSEKVQTAYQKNWNDRVKERIYVAIVEGVVEKKEDTIESYLRENKTTHMYSTSSGQHAITHYQLIKSSAHFSMLRVNIETGRKNQIRVHMHDIGHPIIGDKKYDASQNPIHRLGLHAYRLTLTNPFTKEKQSFTAPIPAKFKRLIKLSERQEANV